MSDQNSQEGIQGNKEFSYAGLCERARQKAAEENQKQEDTKGKGLEFMALRLDIAEKHLELAVTKKITPAEDNLLKVIQMETIGARNTRKHICSRTIVQISELSEKLGYKEKDKIWKLLKSLQTKGYIVREKTINKDQEWIGLNPKVFGQVLADRQHDKEKKRHLTLVSSCG